MANVQYCSKCGYIDYLSSSDIPETCEYCNRQMIVSDCTFEDYMKLMDQYSDKTKQFFFDKYIASCPEFSEEVREARLREERKQDLYSPISKTPNRVKCPYCQSADVKKITATGRAVSVGLFGLASKKIGKQWHCNKCKSDF